MSFCCYFWLLDFNVSIQQALESLSNSQVLGCCIWGAAVVSGGLGIIGLAMSSSGKTSVIFKRFPMIPQLDSQGLLRDCQTSLCYLSTTVQSKSRSLFSSHYQ